MPLSISQNLELCRAGKIPEDTKQDFIKAIDSAVSSYSQTKLEKLSVDVEREFQGILKLVDKALALRERKTWRPKEFRQVLEDISQRLTNLSGRGMDYLKMRNSSIVFEAPKGLPHRTSDAIDPVSVEGTDGQLLALQDLHGVLSGPVARVQVGRPAKGGERALYHFVAAAYVSATGKIPSDTSPDFMAVCDVIKHFFNLEGWNPASCARLARSQQKSDT